MINQVVILFIFFYFINFLFIKYNLLINRNFEAHQNLTSNKKIQLSGGVFIFAGLLFFEKFNINLLLLYSLLFLIIGILSDLQKFNSPHLRFLSQIFLVFTFVFISGVELKDIRVSVINDLLNIYIINFVFVSFCILIIINGFNFIDGLNTLSLGYVLSILIIVLSLHHSLEIMINIEFIINLLIVLIPIFFLNLLNKLYIGDNGSYLLGFLVSIILINLFNENNHISPYFIVLLLWYPGFENLFSIIRKSNYKKSPLRADNNHLHQKIFIFIKKKYLFSSYISNILSANIIVTYNFLIFCLASNFIKSTSVQIILIFINIMIYLFIYNKLKKFN